jgi:hypothetical protein
VSLLRAIRVYRSRREYRPPAGTTHVLSYVLTGESHDSPEGLWELRALDDWLAGDFTRDFTAIEGPASMTEEDFGQFSVKGPDGTVHLDEAGLLGAFEVPAGGGPDPLTVPAWWLEVAS